MKADIGRVDFEEIKAVGEYNKFASGGFWIEYKDGLKVFNCEKIGEEKYKIIYEAFVEDFENSKNESSDDDTFEKIDIAIAAGMIK